jgi:hypothetical protein
MFCCSSEIFKVRFSVKVERPGVHIGEDVQKEDKADGRVNSAPVGFLPYECSTIFCFMFFWQIRPRFFDVKQIDTLPSLPEKSSTVSDGICIG